MIKKNGLIYTLNKKEYLLVNLPQDDYNKNEDRLKELGAIFQGIKEAKMGSFFSSGYVLINLLIPTKNIEEFNNVCYESDKD